MSDSTAIDLSMYRLTKAKELLKQAELLLQTASFDGSINRSYYAIFNAIRSLLALISVDSQEHSGVISLFDKHFVKTNIVEKHFSQIVHTAFEVRQVSDYEDFYTPTAEQAKLQFDNAKKLIQEVETKREQLLLKKFSLPVTG
ncbi:MAG TPA: HEPN domain-containing protein [bacterium]